MSPFGADDTVRGHARRRPLTATSERWAHLGEVEVVDSTVADTAGTVSPRSCFPTAVGAG
jgi:hypothetical protein